MVYLFVGQDLPSKDATLKRIKEEFLSKELKEFNLEVLYSEALTLKELQEKVIYIPAGSQKRIIVIKNAEKLNKDLLSFIANWSKKDEESILLILDASTLRKNNTFPGSLSKNVKVFRFKENLALSTFDLARQIEKRHPHLALQTLSRLLKESEKPEMILGGLRYSLENRCLTSGALQKRVNLILNCDIEIKTGRLKPVFALEKLVISLCALG